MSSVNCYKARHSWRIGNLKYTNEETNNVLTLNQATCKVPLLFWEVKLRKLMCIQQFLIVIKPTRKLLNIYRLNCEKLHLIKMFRDKIEERRYVAVDYCVRELKSTCCLCFRSSNKTTRYAWCISNLKTRDTF